MVIQTCIFFNPLVPQKDNPEYTYLRIWSDVQMERDVTTGLLKNMLLKISILYLYRQKLHGYKYMLGEKNTPIAFCLRIFNNTWTNVLFYID